MLLFRFVFILGVFFTLLGSLFFLVGGVADSIKGFAALFQYGFEGMEEHKPGLQILKGLDLFLVSIVFMILGLGILKIFVLSHVPFTDLPDWLNIKNFKELKILLWETILVTLVVFCLTGLVSTQDALTWNVLILPAVIFVLSLSLFLMKKGEK